MGARGLGLYEYYLLEEDDHPHHSAEWHFPMFSACGVFFRQAGVAAALYLFRFISTSEDRACIDLKTTTTTFSFLLF